MQSIVHSVFSVVVSVIATLLVVGLTGIIVLLLMDQKPAPLLTEDEAEVDRGVTPVVRSPPPQRELSARLRTTH
jgi:hypothetical protein